MLGKLLVEVLQRDGCILSSIICAEHFNNYTVSQLWDNTNTLNLGNCLLCLLSIISQFLDFIHCMVILSDNEH